MALPLEITAESSGQPLLAYLAEPGRRAQWEQSLREHGALLFRGFDVTEQGFAEVAQSFFGSPLPYLYRSTPRTEVGKGVYTATEYPKTAVIPQHCENAYAREWPMKLVFFCAIAATKGGETTLADNRATTARIPKEIVEKFERLGVCYVRNYGSGVDLPWQTVFQTKDRAEVEAYCKDHDIHFEWLKGDKLRTRQVCQATATHPSTGEKVWFNQAHLFHVSSLDEKTQKAMLSIFKKDELPRNAYYGDGSELEADSLATIRAAYHEVGVSWRVGDVLVVDNMLASHGRATFDGARKVLVTMGEPHRPA